MRIMLALFCGLSLAAWADQASGQAKAKFEMSAAEKQFVELTNKERKENKLPALSPSPLLFKVARAHAANMAKQNKMDHNLDGKTSGQRAKEAGYAYYASGENIAAGDFPPPDVMKGWMGSKGHRANVLSTNYTEIGFGIAKNEKGISYFAQVFGKPRR